MKKTFFLLLAAFLYGVASAQVNKTYDVNNDDMVNTADVVAIYNYIINGDPEPGPGPDDYYDANQDGHKGSSHLVSGNRTGDIEGTPWKFEQWYVTDGSGSMTYYDNGTFKASWYNVSEYQCKVGYYYPYGIDRNSKLFTCDYRYTKSGSAQYGYIGAYGWMRESLTEFYIVDDWWGSKPAEGVYGTKIGEYTIDGAKYTIFALAMYDTPSIDGSSTFLRMSCVRETARQEGHIDISAHFAKWDEIMQGQAEEIRSSAGGTTSWNLEVGNRLEYVMLQNEVGGVATGSIDLTYFNMTAK